MLAETANAVVYFRRSVERDNDFIEILHNRLGVLFEQKPGAQYRLPDAERPQARAQAEQIGMHQGLATGEDDPAHSERFDIGCVAVKIRHRDLLRAGGFPDVAHHAAAVAAAVRIEYENRRFHASTRHPAR